MRLYLRLSGDATRWKRPSTGSFFCCRTCQVMQKRSFTAGGFSPDRGKKEEIACAVRANPAEPGRWGGRTRRQNGAQNKAAEQGGKTERQDGAAGRSSRTEQQDGAAGRSGRTGRQDGAAGRGGRKRGGGQSRVIAADKSGAPPAQPPKNGRDNNVPPVLAPGFQPPGAAGQRKSARRSGPASAKGQCTGSQYAVRTPGRVQYYPHGRR